MEENVRECSCLSSVTGTGGHLESGVVFAISVAIDTKMSSNADFVSFKVPFSTPEDCSCAHTLPATLYRTHGNLEPQQTIMFSSPFTFAGEETRSACHSHNGGQWKGFRTMQG